ncbi:MAG TPA: hypothetical protein VMU48_09945 [Terracidiphilus sp.]|nr:hypothetical protein [Terracidiphilus sp.]
MHTHRIQRSLLFLAFGVLISCLVNTQVCAAGQRPSGAVGKVGPLSSETLPQGFQSYKDPQTSGRLIYVKSSDGPASAKTAMRQFLASLNGVFDAPLRITAATSDPQDTVVQAMLSTDAGGQPVEAVAAVATAKGSSIAGLIYDRPDSFRTSYPRLSSYFSKQIGQPVQSKQSSARPDLSTWKRQTGGDGSTNVLMPPDWQLGLVKSGTAILNGPNKEQVVLGLETFVMPNTRGYAPYMPPEQALAWFLRNNGLQLVRVLQHDPTSRRNGGGLEELMMAEISQQDGSRYKAVCRVMTIPTGMNIWQFHLSSIAAPEDRFEASQPTMVAIWNNWKLDPEYVRKSLDDAAKTAAQTRAMIMEGAQRSMHAFDNVNEAIDQAIRGVSTMENTDTGKRAETQIGTERAVIEACKRNSMSCREVPINELVQ